MREVRLSGDFALPDRVADAILVVDDDDAYRRVIEQMLHLEGFAPVTVPNGRAALNLLHAGFPAKAIVLDLLMPIMDGWAFRREQLRDPQLARVPVIVLSALEDAHVDGCPIVRKSADLADIVAEVAALIRAGTVAAER
jgi:CheY-like chemotaxis protein